MKIEELFGTLQQSVVATWRKHLRTHKYSKHMALDEFYKEMPDKVDDLIEAWMGENGRKVNSFENLITSRNMGTLAYLKELKRVCKEGYSLMNGDKSLEALLDDIVELINSTLYKVKELNETQMISLKDFINESIGADLDQRNAERFFGDKFGRNRSLKTQISKSIKALKELKNEFSSDEYDMLTKLIDNPENDYDGRSRVEIYNKEGLYGMIKFTLVSDNMSKAIINKLDQAERVVGAKHGYSANLHSFGKTQTVNINITWYDNDDDDERKSNCIKFAQYVLDTIKPIFDDILSWRDNDKEQMG